MADLFTAQGRLNNLPDLQKVWMWELFVALPQGVQAELAADELVIRVRNVILPGRTITPMETNFMGTKAFHPGKTEYAGTFTTNIEEYEDQKVHATLDAWMQYIFNQNTGVQGSARRLDIVSDITLKMYQGDGAPMPREIKYFNAWPQNVADVTLDYTAGDPVRYDVTWQYDYWRPVPDPHEA